MIQKMAYKNVVSKANEYMSDICRYSSGVVHLSCQNKIELPSPVIEISPPWKSWKARWNLSTRKKLLCDPDIGGMQYTKAPNKMNPGNIWVVVEFL